MPEKRTYQQLAWVWGRLALLLLLGTGSERSCFAQSVPPSAVTHWTQRGPAHFEQHQTQRVFPGRYDMTGVGGDRTGIAGMPRVGHVDFANFQSEIPGGAGSRVATGGDVTARIAGTDTTGVASAEPAARIASNAGHGVGRSYSFSGPCLTVLRSFAKAEGMVLHIKANPPADLTFTISNVSNYSFVDALDALNDGLIAEGMILIHNQNSLTLANTGQPLPDGLIPYVGMEDLPYLGRNMLATVTIPVKRIDPAAAVAEIKELLSSFGHAHALDKSSRIVVTDTGAYLRRVANLLVSSGMTGDTVKSHVYQLKNSPAEEVAAAINHFLFARNPLRANSDKGFQLVVPERITNSLLVHGTVEEIADIQAIINRLDRTPSQVVIQALLVEVQLGDTNELGVELGLQDSVLFDRGLIDNVVSVTEVIEGGGQKVTQQNIVSQRSTPGFNFNNQPLGNNSAANPSSVGTQGLSNFGVGRVNGDLGFGGLVLSAGSESISMLIRALNARFQTDVLSRPQIRALDNHEALIQIGQQVPIVDGVTVSAVGSANPVVRQDKAGIILKVIPRIGVDGMVMINVNAEKSSFQLAPGSGVPIFTDVTNGNVIEAPVKDITAATTSVSVQSGQTIVLGGMITRELSTVARKVPVLGDIPILGRAFRYDFEESTRKELLIFLTPHVVHGDHFDQQLNETEISRMCFPRERAENLYGDLSGGDPGVAHVIETELGPPGPQQIETTDGESVTVPPWSNRPSSGDDWNTRLHSTDDWIGSDAMRLDAAQSARRQPARTEPAIAPLPVIRESH